MPKKTAKTEKAKPEEAAPTAPLSHDVAVGLPRFNFHAPSYKHRGEYGQRS